MSIVGSSTAANAEQDATEAEITHQNLSEEQVLAVMGAAQSIAIAGHVNPDGDAIGSAFALRDLLRAMGKDVVVLLGQDGTPPPELYAFLPDYTFVPASEYTETPDLLIAVDLPTAKRLGTAEYLLSTARDTLVIDHHTNYEGFAHHYYGDITAPATATLIWQIIKASGVVPTHGMALYCYVGIMTDTGRFAFNNTNRTAFADAVEMVDLGVDPAQLSQQIYLNKSLAALRLEALLVDRVHFSCTGSVVYSYILQEDLENLGLTRDATEQLPTILRSIEGVEVAILFREEGGEGVRVNLRSRSKYNVGAFALALGGGGHAAAAGVTLHMPLKEAIDFVSHKLLAELPACNAS